MISGGGMGGGGGGGVSDGLRKEFAVGEEFVGGGRFMDGDDFLAYTEIEVHIII